MGPLPTTLSLLFGYLYELTPLAGRMLRGPSINAARQKANQPEIKYWWLSCENSSALISIVENKNIGSVGFTKLIFVRTAIKKLMCCWHSQ